MNNKVEIKINGKIYVLENPKNESEKLLLDSILYFNGQSKDIFEIIDGLKMSFEAYEGHLEVSNNN